MSIEKGKNLINKVYESTHNNPAFTPEINATKLDMTAIDTFAIPKSLVENPEKFLNWFEPRFFPLKEESDFELFSALCRQALDTIKDQPSLLSPRIGKDLPVSAKAEQLVKRAFTSTEQILALFKRVAIPDDADPKQFFSANRKSAEGAERLSICRILSIAYAFDHIRQSQDLDRLIEYSSFVLGRSKITHGESGLLSSLLTHAPIDILDKPNKKKKFVDWLGKSQVLLGCNLNNIGEYKRKHSYYIPEVHIGTKSGLRALLKILREPEAEFNPLDDFLRLRLIMDDKISTEAILDLVTDLYKEAENKKDPRVKTEIRAKNYLDGIILNALFGEVKSRSETEESGEERDEESDDAKISLEKPSVIKEERDGLFPITIHNNISTGKGYRNISLKVHLHKQGAKKPYFGLEIQILRKGELETNERLERRSSHFLFEMRQAMMTISRLNGKMYENEILRSLTQYLDKNIPTEKMPDMLLGDAKYSEEFGSREIEMPFSGSVHEKAKKLFDFLVAEGTLRHVASNFPSKEIPTRKQRITSGLYIHEVIMSKTLDTLGYKKKKQ